MSVPKKPPQKAKKKPATKKYISTGNPVGRPHLGELGNVPDGQVTIDPGALKTKDFRKEEELLDYIILNIDKFCQDILKDKLISFEAEYPFRKQVKLSPRDKRVDLLIVCRNKDYIVELKNPRYLMENREAIGQLLDYGREYLDSKKEMPELILITSRYDISTIKTIKHYNLPIRYIYLDKTRRLELSEE